MAKQTFMYRLNILSSYQTAVLLMGVLTLEFLIAYFIGMILTRSNDWKNELFEFIKREPWNVFFFRCCLYGLSYVQCIRLINILQYLEQSTDMKAL